MRGASYCASLAHVRLPPTPHGDNSQSSTNLRTSPSPSHNNNTTTKDVAVHVHLQAVRRPPALHHRSHRPHRHRHGFATPLESALIAGANVGLGLEAARHLAR